MYPILQSIGVLRFLLFLQAVIAKQRRDNLLSDRDFLLSAAQVLTRDEKSPLLKLIAQIANPTILQQAADEGLIKSPDPVRLGIAIYEFRNSIVHAKYDQKATLVVDSVISPPKITRTWKSVLERLANAAIASHGTFKRL